MLVVLASVALLMAVTLPVVGRVGAAARSMRCAANLRQIASATIAYAAVHDDRYPAAILYFKRSDGIEIAAWDWIQGPGGALRPGPLWAFADAPAEVLQCPDFHGASTFGNDPATGYSYNTSFIGAEGSFPTPKPGGGWVEGWAAARLGVAGPQHRRTSQTALFADAGWKSGANKFMRAPLNTVEGNLQLLYAGGQAFRHDGCCNVVYLDGHCACVSTPRRGALATETLLNTIMDFPRNGFLSDDDSAYDPR
jgi:prepilin-type processing-associated H-X9-DG protein